jgi:hypothetical protein
MASLLDLLGSSPFAVPPELSADPNEVARFARGRGITGLAQGLLAAGAPSRTPVSMGQALGQGLLGFSQGQDEANKAMYSQGLLGLSIRKQQQEKEAAEKEAARQAQIGEIIKNLPPQLQQAAMADPDNFFKQYQGHQLKQAFPDPVENKPLTEAAQLNADLAAGRIDQATYDALIKKATHIAQTEGAGGSGGPFAGNALDAQDSNILIKGDPGSPEYAMAYQRQFLTPRWTMTEQGMVPIMPTPPQGIRPPTGTVAQAPTTGMPEETLQPASGAPKSTISPSQGFSVGAPLPGTEKAPTEGQLSSAGYASRMEASEQTMQRLMGEGFDPSNAKDHLLSSVPLGNYAVSKEWQQHRQAQEDWVRAKLRKESGAVIADDEMEREIKVNFPQPGDSKEVIAQKARTRALAASGMKNAAGHAYKAPQSSAPKLKYNPDTGKVE